MFKCNNRLGLYKLKELIFIAKRTLLPSKTNRLPLSHAHIQAFSHAHRTDFDRDLVQSSVQTPKRT